jgi:hypothetical protein
MTCFGISQLLARSFISSLLSFGTSLHYSNSREGSFMGHVLYLSIPCINSTLTSTQLTVVTDRQLNNASEINQTMKPHRSRWRSGNACLVYGRYLVRISAGTPANLKFFTWFSSVPPDKCWDITSIRPQPFLSKSFLIHGSSIITPFDTI